MKAVSRPFALAALLSAASAVRAQSNSTAATNGTSTSSSANSGANPLIPTDVSTGCQNFLADLNGDPVLAACTQPVLDIVAAINPASSPSSPGDVAQLLNQTCTAAYHDECADGYLRGLLRSFAGNCSAELTADVHPVVAANYDVLYAMQPFRQAMCSIDSKTGTYCIEELAAGEEPSATGDISTTSSSVPLEDGQEAVSTGLPGVSSNATAGNVAAKTGDADFDIAQYAGLALEPANLVVQLTNKDAADLLRKRQSGVALPDGSPGCATNCWSSKLGEAGNYGLDQNSASSLCGSADWIKSYTTCAEQNCGSSDLETAKKAQATVCSSGSTSSPSGGGSTTTTPAVESDTAAAPNATTFQLSNLPYLFLSADMGSAFACTQCTKTVLLRYLQWESSIPYVSGLASSALLGGQPALWTGLSATCGSGFTASIEAGTTTGDLGGGAPAGLVAPLGTLAAAAAALFALL